ncbi:carbohydrate-binding domain-containing protein [Azospirillum agricola]|uniref:carbohydrate-binding domain-containing protein n=1 Tax=Azospirillum agricola TaxID=1720247 RepID=UPI000A0F089F|nr:carbohydrate-binding domain-containing protein [Azospirillum agricola]SMH47428.1 Glycosyl hydrolases family 16 [Azospirillum lipoferum]
MANLPPQAPAGSTWKLVFDDEFNGTKVDTTKWTDSSSAEADGGHGNLGNRQLEWNQMKNATVSDGILSLTAKRESYTSASGTHYDWTSGLLTTSPSFTFQYGYIEERAKMPAEKGFWPAFWTWQAPGVNSWQETDAYEYYSDNKSKIYLTSHAGSGGGSIHDLPFDPTTDFHTYGVDIRPTGTTWYIDGVKVASASGSPSAPTNIITNLAVFKDIQPAASTMSATKQVDYVRAYSYDAGAKAVTPQEGYDGPGATPTTPTNPTAPTTPTTPTTPTAPTEPTSPTAGKATIVVNASGTPAGGVNAHFKLLVDGKQVGEGTAGATAKDYSFTADVTPDQAHKIQVQYDNDGWAGGQDRNLKVNTVSVNGHVYKATDSAVTYDKGALDGRDVVKGQADLWWNGTLVVNAGKADFPAGATTTPTNGNSTITVNATGTPAGGVNAHFKLLVDGKQVGEATTGTTAKDYSFTTNLTADQAHKVQVQYDNDGWAAGQDRNLTVSKITINGKAVSPTDSIVSYDKYALDGKEVVKGQADMWWEGTLVVNADKSFFPAAKAAMASAASVSDAMWTHLAAQQAPAAEAALDSHHDTATGLTASAAELSAYALGHLDAAHLAHAA